MVRRFFWFLILVVLLVGAYFTYDHYRQQRDYLASDAELHGDPAHPADASNWVDTRLYFGLGPADVPDKGVPDAAWRDFLDKEVTPRIPSGLSVIDVYGQWQVKEQKTPERVRTKLLIIDYPDTRDNRDRIEAIRLAWKKKTGDQSVLKVTQPADVSF